MDDEFVVSDLDVTKHSKYPIVRIRFFNKERIERSVVLPLDGMLGFVNVLIDRCELRSQIITGQDNDKRD
jgi:hypothetical protein